MKRLLYHFRQYRQKMIPRVMDYILLAFLTALAAHYLGPMLPPELYDFAKNVNTSAILLTLVTTMLTISTFAVSTTVSANMNAVASTTPRAFHIILKDQRTQNMLVVFIGSFAFSLATLIINPFAIETHGGQFILLVVIIAILVRILIVFINWTISIRELGSMSNTLAIIEEGALKTFRKYWKDPSSGCQTWREAEHDTDAMAPVYFGGGLYVQLIDEALLETVARERKIEIYVNCLEGDFVSVAEPMVWIKGALDDGIAMTVRDAFVLAEARDIDVDGRFGIIMLKETACKALSAAINDAGTGMACVHSVYRILSDWPDYAAAKIRHSHVWRRPIEIKDCMAEFYLPVVNDAGNLVEVHVEVMTSLAALSNSKVPECAEAAKNLAHECYERAMTELRWEGDQERVRAIFRKI